jgi:hypothetical protein
VAGTKGDDPNLRRKVLADLVASRARGGMRATPRAAPNVPNRKAKPKRISQVVQVMRR